MDLVGEDGPPNCLYVTADLCVSGVVAVSAPCFDLNHGLTVSLKTCVIYTNEKIFTKPQTPMFWSGLRRGKPISAPS